MKHRILSLILATAMISGLAGCGNKAETETTTTTEYLL